MDWSRYMEEYDFEPRNNCFYEKLFKNITPVTETRYNKPEKYTVTYPKQCLPVQAVFVFPFISNIKTIQRDKRMRKSLFWYHDHNCTSYYKLNRGNL